MAEKEARKTPHFFAVPVLLMRTLALKVPPGAVSQRMSAVAEDFDIVVDVFSFSGQRNRAAAIATLKKNAANRGVNLVSAVCNASGVACDMLVAAEPTAEEALEEEEGSSDELASYLLAAKAFIESDMRQLRQFSRFTGLRIVYRHGTGYVRPALPEEPNTVRLILCGRPPGLYEMEMAVKDLFGIKVWKNGEVRYVNTPSRGRGRVIEESGNSVFQVMGRDYYQLCLTFSDAHDVVGREVIFRKLLGCMYRDLALDDVWKQTPWIETTEEEFAAFGRERAGKVLADLRKNLRTTEFNIEKLEDDLAKQLRERQVQITRIKAMENSAFVRDLHERLPREFGEMRHIEGVSAVRIVDDGVHLETESIVLEYGGRRYDLGPFVIRLDPTDGHVEVWSEAPRHAKGHHHPHINRKSLACYGNVTIPIAKFMAAYRFADAARIVMRWLKTYSPETTLIPIEEWSAISTTETQKEDTHDGTSPEPVAAA